MPVSLKTYSSAIFSITVTLAVLFLLIATGEAFRIDFNQQAELAGQRYGASGRKVIQDWQNVLSASADQDHSSQLQQVNQFTNRHILYVEDLDLWGKKDYWATPLESFGRGAGDCEDSAIVKYVSLLLLGIPDSQLRLTYVRAKLDGVARAHMVLTYYPAPDQEPLILDSLRNEILPASRRPDLFPVFSFNASGLWVGGKRFPEATASARLSNWRSVLSRMKEEGWQ